MKKALLIIGIVILALGLLGPGAMAGPPVGAKTVIMIDKDGDYLEVKDSGAALSIGVDYAHHEIHDGKHYFTFHAATLASGAKILLLVNTPATGFVHMILPFRSSGESHIELWEGTAVSALGTAKAEVNRNRNSTNISSVEVTLTPTITDAGTMIWEEHIGAGQNRGGDSRTNNEIVLDQSNVYLINVVSEAASNDVDVIPDWYEDTGDAP